MANSWNGPQLGSPIRTDVPELQKKLIALLKGDPTSVADIPSGAKRLVNTSGVQWQVQQYNGSSWTAIGKLMHDVDQLDGYHAAITPAANTVAVRNADKKLEGDITGNATTASSAATLSETLPVNKGGTGATTSAAARSNLGVPPTSHASSNTTYGLATDTNYGHVRSDGTTTNIVSGEVVVKDIAIDGDVNDLASGRGQIGDIHAIPNTVDDLNNLILSGVWYIGSSTSKTIKNIPPNFIGSGCFIKVYAFYYGGGDFYTVNQKIWKLNTTLVYRRLVTQDSASDWTVYTGVASLTSYGMVKLTNDVDSGSEKLVPSAKALKELSDSAVKLKGDQDIDGRKFFYLPRMQGKNFAVGDTVSATSAVQFDILDKNKERFAGMGGVVRTNGNTALSLYCKPNVPGSNDFKYLNLTVAPDGTAWGEAPNPPADSDINHIATTKWVRDRHVISTAVPTSNQGTDGDIWYRY